ncbi:hypothetical protein DYBT9275_01990 [Dyadobacter sp. CECT 9275]|uniref:Glycosyltransferase n=2 Tax=Dyadobacter helix TaxID=2822344 RepID=A0A916JBA1_9BACT|nr:hypothetical protein DYBT9275_01990 [Dyadobacter sp. CECT 9275]
MVDTWADNYVLIGPYFREISALHFRPSAERDNTPLNGTVAYLRSLGFEVMQGHWLMEGARPKVILINPVLSTDHLNEIKARLWQQRGISCLNTDELTDQVIGFGELVRIFLTEFAHRIPAEKDIVGHFHEWMSASGLPDVSSDQTRIATVFSTNATIPGRYMASNEADYYSDFTRYDWGQRIRQYNIEAPAGIERAAAQKAQVLTTNNVQTARECEIFFERSPDNVIPGSLNLRTRTHHETFELHKKNKTVIDAFIKGHFSPSYQLNTDRTLYLFTAGRYEYKNKGFDVTLEAAARLNQQLRERRLDINIVLFVISKRPFHYIKPEVLEAKARFLELQKICQKISKGLGPQLYTSVASHRNGLLPNLNEMLDAELLLTWRQALLNFRTHKLPAVTTHELVWNDEITDFLQREGLDNREDNPVKVVYHPDFLERTRSPLGMDFKEFVAGCHLGIFPDLYQPWGYTPMETVMSGTPAILSDASGFGHFIKETIKEPWKREVHFMQRKHTKHAQAVDELTEKLLGFVMQYAHDQFVPRTDVSSTLQGSFSSLFMNKRYNDSFRQALLRRQPETHLY